MQDPGGGTCPLPMSVADTGALTAVKAQLCNYPMSMGMQHWYRLSATLPGAPPRQRPLGAARHRQRRRPRLRLDPRRRHPRVPHLTGARPGKVAVAVAIQRRIADTRRCTAR
jgi:hypothetical protein